ncbi:dephospho-CoA kinase [Hydrogenophaga pseudoflava]|uniref:dephospho-CoA kinase n=1 Tax=Hydrogenophaga pseudoflava TaxID=47421 RepID=UPI0027E3D2F4|nr:dephospho-CoA kinase [Hydrogenophaga pseudoflava]MDQ7743427.1 dephospho-CoA kinase [Hydrogenophaga pseudoflava]
MRRLGLTGGIGSGKSTVAKVLQVCGATILDADHIARRSTLAGGAAMPDIQYHFGDAFVARDGSMDRDKMRAHVFAHPSAKQLLESLIHPRVHEEMERLVEASTADCVVFDVPLLVESDRWRPRLDAVLVVDCTHETQITRVMARNGWPRPQVESVLAQQSTRARRLACADGVIWNEGIDLPTLQSLVREMAGRLGL